MEIFLKTISAVNDKTRVKILAFIQKYDEVCVCDVENSFLMGQSRVSRHLKILKEAGFLSIRRDGRWAYYKVRKPPLDIFRQEILKEIKTIKKDIPTIKKGCQNG